MKSGLWAGDLSDGGNISSGRTTGQDVRESGDILPSLATTRWVAMSVQGGGGSQEGC
jgi:hypothetical protein